MNIIEAKAIAVEPKRYGREKVNEALKVIGEAFVVVNKGITEIRENLEKVEKEFREYKDGAKKILLLEQAKTWREAERLSTFAGDAGKFVEKAREVEKELPLWDAQV